MKRKSALFRYTAFFHRRCDYGIIQFHESMPRPRRTRGGGYEWNIELNLELAPDHRRTRFIAGFESSNSWAMLGCFFECEIRRRGPFKCIYLFDVEKTAAREKRRRWQTKLHAKWRRHLFSQLRKKKFLFVIFTTMHSTSQFLLALRDDSLWEKIRRRAEQRRLTIVKCFFRAWIFTFSFLSLADQHSR